MDKEYKTFEKLKEELGDKFEEFMYKANINLLDKVNQLETNRDEVIRMVKSNNVEVLKYYDEPSETGSYEIVTIEILSLLERGKK